MRKNTKTNTNTNTAPAPIDTTSIKQNNPYAFNCFAPGVRVVSPEPDEKTPTSRKLSQ